MTDDLDITSGGVISIDSGSLRAAADRLSGLGAALDDACDLVTRAQAMVMLAAVGSPGVGETARRIAELAQGMRTDAHGVELMADTFEYVELSAQHEALSIRSPEAALAVQRRMEQLVANDPDVMRRALMLRDGWTRERLENVGEQTADAMIRAVLGASYPTDVIRALLVGGAVIPGVFGFGRPGHGEGLRGQAPPVKVDVVSRRATTPTTGLQDSIRRIPYGEEGQVVVEKYTMNDGSETFVAYLDGTRELLPSDDPWDMGSNWDMYIDQEVSASYEATRRALAEAGVTPQTELALVTYSQGGAIGTYVATSPDYDVSTMISIGNPTAPSLDVDQTLIDIRHRGDPVSLLSGGGSADGTGSPESFSARASVVPGLPLKQHRYENYLDTAGQLDASGDPRVAAFHESFYDRLGEAVSVERMEFKAVRP